MNKLNLSLLLGGFLYPFFLLSQSVQSPAEFLGYQLGETFTWHHQVVSYYEHVGDNSDKVLIQPYGSTNEGRKLLTAIVSAEKNMAKVEVIRKNHLKRIGLMKGEVDDQWKEFPIVYLSYNIHGNESSSTEAAMATLYQLVTNDTASWLEEMIVILDPCINPDGRDRYVNWYKRARGANINTHGNAWEHREAWPGGRYNHYLFDLNRDWAWQTQKESRERVIRYQSWMPHVHIDFHEMGANSPYFFAPPAKPINDLTTSWQSEFHELLGENHASYFNKNGWLFFTKEVFDLFYPSYGDTWPTFQGAMGLTYEQGGGGYGGLGVDIANGTTLKLSDRIAHHFTTGLSTIEVAYQNRDRMTAEFLKYFKEAVESPYGTYKAYVIKHDNEPSRISALLALMDKNQIQYGHPSNAIRSVQGYSYQDNRNESFELDQEDIIISAYQPRSRLVQALFEPKPHIEDSITYDLTAWAMPFAYDLDAYASKTKIAVSENSVGENPVRTSASSNVYAFLGEWKDASDVALLSALAKEGIKSRFAKEPFELDGNSYDRGTLIITRADNPQDDFGKIVQKVAQEQGKFLQQTNNGKVSSGKDLGSGSVPFIGIPKVAIVNGDGVTPTAFGSLWYYFDQDIKYPVDILHTRYLAGVDLSEYDVLVLPSGSYGRFSENITNFVREGGRVIALERAISLFSTTDEEGNGTALAEALSAYEEEEEKEAEKKAAEAGPEELLNRYDDQVRDYVSGSAPGSVYRVDLDDSHPLAFGLGSHMFLIKQSSTVYPYMDGGWNVGVFKSGEAVSGFTGARLMEQIPNSLAFGAESMGRGEIIYFPEDPNFRSFWHVGKLLLGNAVFMKF